VNRVSSLAGFLALDFLRHRLMVFLLLLFPLLIIFMAVQGAPDQPVPIHLDGDLVVPMPAPEEIQVLSFTMTAVALVGALTGFFTGFQLKSLTMRLEVLGVKPWQVGLAQAIVLVGVDVFVVAFAGNVSRFWIEPVAPGWHYGALLLGTFVFTLFGLILARVADSRALGLNVILAVAVLDTAFLENPVLSRRFTEGWLDILPAHRPVQLLYRAGFTGQDLWGVDAAAAVLYSLVLSGILIAVMRIERIP